MSPDARDLTASASVTLPSHARPCTALAGHPPPPSPYTHTDGAAWQRPGHGRRGTLPVTDRDP
jgi:hypothetical protein